MARSLHAGPSTLRNRNRVTNKTRLKIIKESIDADPIVLDEDEFAGKLIPELFKHRNYASFVRQLNMYGFHKRVGLSDNSMKASERKNKAPSEYYNPYFRRGHPNLLWLINKPKSGKNKKNKRDENDVGSDDDVAEEEERRRRGEVEEEQQEL